MTRSPIELFWTAKKTDDLVLGEWASSLSAKKDDQTTESLYELHMTQLWWLLMLHCRVVMLLVIDAMCPAAAGAVPLTPRAKINLQKQFTTMSNPSTNLCGHIGNL